MVTVWSDWTKSSIRLLEDEIKQVMQERLEALKKAYFASLPPKSRELERALLACQAANWGPPELQQLHQHLHRLAGSLGLHGLDQLQQCAGRLCELTQEAQIGGDCRQQLSKQVGELVVALNSTGVASDQDG